MGLQDDASGVLQRYNLLVSYAAITHGGVLLQGIQPHSQLYPAVFGVVALMASVGMHRSLETVVSMFAAQQISGCLPLPQEPAGYLLMPGILLYFACVSCIITTVRDAGLSQQLVYFAGMRGLTRFLSVGQSRTIGVVSIVYMLLTNKSDQAGWLGNMRRITDCLCERGATQWLPAMVTAITGVSGTVNLAGMYILMLLLNPFQADAYMKSCSDVLMYTTTQLVTVALQQLTGHYGVCILITLHMGLTYMGVTKHVLNQICLFGIAICMTTATTNCISLAAGGLERVCIFVAIFLGISCVLDSRMQPEYVQQVAMIALPQPND